MAEKKTVKWIKKYMKFEYLEDTLRNARIHMSIPLDSPNTWDDKNETYPLKAYCKSKSVDERDFRIACFTVGPDRYHMWDIYGGKRSGVCLWFNFESFSTGVETLNDDVRKGMVGYYTPNRLVKNCGPENLPFAKREQYRDEREYRIISTKNKNKEFNYPRASLKRIYVNSWLDSGKCNEWKSRINNWLDSNDYSDVEVWRSRITNSGDWEKSVKKVGEPV